MNLSVRRKASGVMKIVVVLVFVLVAYSPAALPQPIVKSVEAVGMTVSDMDRSIEFFPKVLSFERISDVEVAGGEYERLQGVFGARMRVARLSSAAKS
jgi:hypothetical protein